MKIGVWLGFDIKESAGGAFSYTDRLIQLIDDHTFPEGIEVCFLNLLGGGEFKKDVYSLLSLPKSLIRWIKHYPYLFHLLKSIAKHNFKRKGIKHSLDKLGIKILYYIHQGECLDSNFPFIATNWDIGHRSTYAFPELIWDGKTFEEREFYYKNVLPKAMMVFCESKAGVEEIVKYTNIGEHKLRVLPMFGGGVTQQALPEEEELRILTEYGLIKNGYFFYPAQFWAHKNHKNLIEAFSIFHKSFPNIKLVLSGSDKGNIQYIKRLINELGLSDYVVFLGFVSISIIYCMYNNAIALVMASHFGPTNMPPIEAMEIGCPVACSDLDGHHEILGDAAAFFDSYDVKSMINAMRDIYLNNEDYRKRISIQKEVTRYSEDNVMEVLNGLLTEVVNIRSCWN